MIGKSASEIRAKSWRDRNSTLEKLISWLGLLIALALVGLYLDSQIEKHKGLISSYAFGCEIPPRLTGDNDPPPPPRKPDGDDIGQWMLWYDDRLTQLHATIQAGNNDKAEIRALCN